MNPQTASRLTISQSDGMSKVSQAYSRRSVGAFFSVLKIISENLPASISLSLSKQISGMVRMSAGHKQGRGDSDELVSFAAHRASPWDGIPPFLLSSHRRLDMEGHDRKTTLQRCGWTCIPPQMLILFKRRLPPMRR